MDFKQRASIAQEGAQLLKQGIFPNELLERVKEKRLRNDISDKIFYPKGSPKYVDLTESQKKDRARRLRVELAFVRYTASFDSMRYSSILLLLVGLITLFFWTIYQNGNFVQGWVTVIEALILFVISFKNQTIIQHSKLILTVSIGLLLIEILFFQLPNPFLSGATLDWYDGSRRAVAVLFNELSAYLYLLGKLTIIGFIAMTYFRIIQFTQEKMRFERN